MLKIDDSNLRFEHSTAFGIQAFFRVKVYNLHDNLSSSLKPFLAKLLIPSSRFLGILIDLFFINFECCNISVVIALTNNPLEQPLSCV